MFNYKGGCGGRGAGGCLGCGCIVFLFLFPISSMAGFCCLYIGGVVSFRKDHVMD